MGETFSRNPFFTSDEHKASVISVTCYHVTLMTLCNVALKIDPKVPAELLSRVTTIPQPDAMNSTEANQTSPVVCAMKLCADVWADRDNTTERITGQ